MAISVHAIRRALRTPRAYYRRHQTGTRQLFFEQTQYSPATYAFQAASIKNPDLLVDFDIDANSLVFDVGAFVGDWTEKVSRRTGARVYAFEPNPRLGRHLRTRLAGYPKVTALNYGLGGSDATARLSLHGLGSSTHDDSSRFETAIVRIRDIAEVLDELRIDHIDLLKLNIEGSEYDLLERLIETRWTPRIGTLVVQFHEWLPKSHRRRRAIQRALRATHTPLWDYPWIWEAWRNHLAT
jgi:FkbM family methyltransferase